MTEKKPKNMGFGFKPRAKLPPLPKAQKAPDELILSFEKLADFDQFPDYALLRESQLVTSPKRPGAVTLLPFSAPTLWRKVKSGQFPPPLKFGPRIKAWRVGDVRQWLEEQGLQPNAD